VGDHDSVFSKAIGGLLFILGFEQSDFLRGGHIDTAAAQSIGNGRVAAFIEVEANRPSHWSSVL
jgi:hypothetical protein